MPFYFIQKSDLTGGAVHIGMPLAHHLIDVLRYQKGDSLTLVDQDRNKYVARIRSITARSIEGEVLSKDTPPQQQKPILHLGIALLKGDKMDWAIQKATELGVERISPLMTRRVVAKIHNNKIAHQQKRWFEIAKEGSQQSERLEIPKIDVPLSLDSFLKETVLSDMKCIFWEKAPPGPLAPIIRSALSESPNNLSIIIGPEGGLEKEEVDQALEKGYIAVSLGARPVRAETAALAAITILQYEIGNVTAIGR